MAAASALPLGAAGQLNVATAVTARGAAARGVHANSSRLPPAVATSAGSTADSGPAMGAAAPAAGQALKTSAYERLACCRPSAAACVAQAEPTARRCLKSWFFELKVVPHSAQACAGAGAGSGVCGCVGVGASSGSGSGGAIVPGSAPEPHSAAQLRDHGQAVMAAMVQAYAAAAAGRRQAHVACMMTRPTDS
jgi:hypothetical protein